MTPSDPDLSAERAAAISGTMIDLVRLFRSFKNLSTDLLPGMDIAGEGVLLSLAQGPLRVGQLAVFVHADISTVSRQVTVLQGMTLVEKIPDPTDRRASLVALTVPGQKRVEQLRQQRLQWLIRFMSDWSEQEVDEFHRLLIRLADGVGRERDRGSTRQALPTPPHDITRDTP